MDIDKFLLANLVRRSHALLILLACLSLCCFTSHGEVAQPNNDGSNNNAQSDYWTKAQQTHDFVVGNLLTPYHSYSTVRGATSAYEWYSASQIYADAAMVINGDPRYNAYMNNSYAWMNNMWDNGNPIGGYFAAANTDGTNPGGGKYVDDNSLTGMVYLDCYDATTGATKQAYLASAEAIANWLMQSGQWDSTYGGGFWWSDSKTLKPTQSNGLAMQLFLRLYQITGQTYYRDWAISVKDWLEGQMFDSSDGLYIWEITNGAKNLINFTYDNAIMIDADLLYARVMHDESYLAKAEDLAKSLNARLWNDTYGSYYFNTADGRVNPTWCVWASQALMHLYDADHDPKWIVFAQRNIDYMNHHLRDNASYGYYEFCNMDGSNLQADVDGVDQAWMERVQGMMSKYRQRPYRNE
jgi:uncharacterized protein YyaL (SSP411 family)